MHTLGLTLNRDPARGFIAQFIVYDTKQIKMKYLVQVRVNRLQRGSLCSRSCVSKLRVA